jgi:hypothetical protein
MSPLLDDIDESSGDGRIDTSQIRSALLHLPVGDDGTADMLRAVRAGARSRRNRRRVGAITAAVVALGLAGFSVSWGTDDQPVLTASGPEAPTTATTGGYPPLTPLADGPLPVVPNTTLLDHDGYVQSVESLPGRVILRDQRSLGGGGSIAFDPETTSALVVSEGSWSSEDPDRKRHVLGVTRADVVRVEWIVPSGTLSAETFGLPALPQLRFFFIEDPQRTVSGNQANTESRFDLPHVIAYGADGTVLADSKKILEYEAAHAGEVEAREVEVDRRRGVEVKDAGIADARVENEGLTVEIYKCEGDPMVEWTANDTAIELSATVKRPIAEGPCLSGDTKVVSIDFGEPVGDRPIIEALTGNVLIEAGAGL